MLRDMKNASNGMVSDFELVNNANKAMALGIAKSDIAGLLETATARAKVFGRTTTEAFNDLTIGIGRQSRMILDNLGIILDLDKVNQDYAKTLGKTSDELTEAEKKQALVNSIMTESAGLVAAQTFLEETHTEKIQRLSASYQNLKEKVGNYLLSVFDEITGVARLQRLREEEIDSLTGMPGTYDKVAEQVLKLTTAQRSLGEELGVSKTNAQKLIDSLLNIKDITFGGESEAGLDVAKQNEVVRKLELQIAKGKDLQKIADQDTSISNQEELIRQLKLRELAGEDVVDVMKTEQDRLEVLKLNKDKLNSSEMELNQLLNEEKNNLEILRLVQQEFDNERAIQSQQNKIDLEDLGQLQTSTFKEFESDQEDKIQSLLDESNRQKEIEQNILDVNDRTTELAKVFSDTQLLKEKGYNEEEQSIQDIINETDKLIGKYKEASDARGIMLKKDKKPRSFLDKVQSALSFGLFNPSSSGGSSSVSQSLGPSQQVNDFILTSSGQLIQPSPQDTLIGTKHPEDLGGQGITFQIENIYGVDSEQVAEALGREIKRVIRL